MRSIYDIVDQALKDPAFATEIAAKATAASRRGGRNRSSLRNDEWAALLDEFAEGPDELARLQNIPDDANAAGTTWTTTTTSTITTTTTFACTTTSTTTVTGTITVTLEA